MLAYDEETEMLESAGEWAIQTSHGVEFKVAFSSPDAQFHPI